MRTVVGLFPDKNEARRTVEDLKRIGVREGDVSMLSNDESNGPISAYLDPAAGAREPDAITRALVRMGLSEHEARRYVAGVQNGYTLETVAVDDAKANDALEIMRSHAVGIGRGEGFGRTDRRAEAPAETRTETPAETRTETRTEARTEARADEGRAGSTEEVVPVIVEELAVGKREVEAGGVRVTSKVEELPVEEDVSLRTERIEVERRPVDRPIAEGDVDALADREIEVVATAEEAVVEKTAKIVEEVVVTKDVDTRTETIRETVRRTDVEVEAIPYDAAAYRDHHGSNYAEAGGFDEYEPAYRYGHEMRGTSDAADWSTVESDARTDWEKKRPNTWERFKGAIRHAFERARAKKS
ncbi:MAG: uncharacterized protein JWP87_97 [Labilithrix sp.]|nr:uncharacterized protein [Labilithrix sp.]